MTDNQKLEGKVYIGVVGAEIEVSACRDSMERLTRRPGDLYSFVRGTKGYETRQSHINRFMANPEMSFIFLMDGDMILPTDALERLREHGKPFVSGFYMRRRFDPIAPVWFEPGDTLPFKPWSARVEANKLYEIGASGWGCILVHRMVIEAVRKILHGEPDIIEDDMDVWPYDLKEVMAGREKLRPLRAVKDVIMGSDIRFAFFARQVGFPLYGDSGVSCGHVLNYPVTMEDYNQVPDDYIKKLADKYQADYDEESQKLEAARQAANG